jgi:hypothetical protein
MVFNKQKRHHERLMLYLLASFQNFLLRKDVMKRCFLFLLLIAIFAITVQAGISQKPGQKSAAAVKEKKAPAAQQKVTKLPKFADYPVTEKFTGPLQPIKIVSKKAKQYRTMLRNGYKEGVNFAGHYVLVEWGCGSPCQEHAIVDAHTGTVYVIPGETNWGVDYKPDSKLLILNPREEEQGRLVVPADVVYLVWENNKLHEVYRIAEEDNETNKSFE